MNLFLIGYRGTGKSTIGRLLAERISWTFVDADIYLESKAKRTIKEIFAAEGETAFRNLESEVVAELSAGSNQVLALGGGAILREINRLAIQNQGPVVWLQAAPETIFNRITVDPATVERRPDLTAYGGYDEIKHLLEQREPIYRQCAQHVVDTEGKTAAQVVAEILVQVAPLFSVRDT